MGRWVITVVALAAALAAPSSLAQVVLSPSVFHSHDLPSNTITTFTVTCPSGHLATSAGISNPASGVTLLSVRPVGFSAYTFRFGNPVTNPGEQVTVVVACRKINNSSSGPPLTLKLKPVQIKVKLPPGKQTAASFLCPPRTAPAGTGSDLSPARGGQKYVPGAADRISIREVSMHLHGFSFSIRNNGGKAQTIALYGNCLTVVRPAGTRAERLGIKITTSRSLIEPGKQSITRRCPKGWFSLAAGYVLRSPLHTIDGAAAIGTGGKWWVASDAQVPALVDLQLVCGMLHR